MMPFDSFWIQVQEHAIKDQAKQGGDVKPQIFSGLRVYVSSVQQIVVAGTR